MSRKEKNPNAQWFVEPNDAFANEAIIGHLNRLGEGSLEIEQVKIADTHGQLHNVLEVSYKTLCDLVKTRKLKPEFKFRIWNRTRFRAPLRDCEYLFAGKSIRQSAEFKRIKNKLAQTKTSSNPDEPEPF